MEKKSEEKCQKQVEQKIEIWGARENNLKDINLTIPKNKLIVITGVSGSGKSSIAFDTLYKEGKRRYMESFSAYARYFLGNIERPDVDKIDGLSPVIAIQQKTTIKNNRSTVGTTTEIYDFLRLIYAKIADAYSYISGKKMVKQTQENMKEMIQKKFFAQHILLLAPLVRGKKGNYQALFQTIHKKGFTKIRINGKIQDIDVDKQLDRYKIHNIELVIDHLYVDKDNFDRLRKSLATALKEGNGLALLQDENKTLHYLSQKLMDPQNGLAYEEPAPNHFSFNSPYGACPTCNGLGETISLNLKNIIPNNKLSIQQGGIIPLGTYRPSNQFKKIQVLLYHYNQDINTPINNFPEQLLKTILYGTQNNPEIYHDTDIDDDFTYKGLMEYLQKRIKEDEDTWVIQKTCESCKGGRLKKSSLHFKIAEKNIFELSKMDLKKLQKWLQEVEKKLTEKQQIIAYEPLREIQKRLKLLLDIGLSYLTLHRPLKTLSGGETQRIRLATQIGTQLVGVLYILDEPSIGLHQQDNEKLIQALQSLRDLGNTVLVVEHDKDMMLAADHIIDIGPKAGIHGGKVIAAGSLSMLRKNAQQSITTQYLHEKINIPIPPQRRKGNNKNILLAGCHGHNLKNVDLKIPLEKFICITGMSGSGKSTLIHDTLFPILNKHFYRAIREPLPYKNIQGLNHIDKVIAIDQSPIGKTSRSNPATYTGVFTEIRNIFSLTPEAKMYGYKPGIFSFNTNGGRCETCEGAGLKTIEMEFLSKIYILCETCQGKRYNQATLMVHYKGKNISDVLNMTIEDAALFFEKYPNIKNKLQALQHVGLGYLTLGQSSTTLSGGEAQRVKLASELAKKNTGKTIYILDEPTTGLHFQDIEQLLTILHHLVDQGNTVIVIEHNMDVIKTADHIIDIGPDGGIEGGEIICQGKPEDILDNKKSYTVKFLKKELKGR